MMILPTSPKTIISDEVWGRTRSPAPMIPIIGPPTNFFRFSIDLQETTIIIPVACLSPQYIGIDVEKLTVSNHFDAGTRVTSHNEDGEVDLYLQWFSNCLVHFDGLKVRKQESLKNYRQS